MGDALKDTATNDDKSYYGPKVKFYLCGTDLLQGC